MMLGYNTLEANMSPIDPKDPSTWGALRNGNIQKFEAEFGGVKLSNIQPHEVESAVAFAKGLGFTVPKLVPSAQISPQTTPLSKVEPIGGATIDEAMERFRTRKKGDLDEKTLYEYGNYHRKFSEWVAVRKDNKNFPIKLVTRVDIADYIDELKLSGLSSRTIKDKYMSALNGLFDIAQTSGLCPEGVPPTRGHKIISQKKLNKLEDRNSYKPFINEELAKIFLPENLLKRPKPDDFWLPLLGLFTGGRSSELCQLFNTDIKKEGDIWSMSINDEEYKKLKTEAARRVIPIHPQLLALGFIDYVEDTKPFGVMLFPYLTADRFGKFNDTPGERFGKYLDSLDITDPLKVFHSFRKTSNNKLKQSNVAEETRCQFVGHVYETTNSSDYGEDHDLAYLLEHAAKKLVFDGIAFDKLAYTKGQFSKKLAHLCKIQIRGKNNRDAKAKREEAQKNRSA
jgi:integrase